MSFKRGDPIEVCSDEEGFKGAWFPATIVRKAGSGFLVEFKDLVADDEKSKLREKVEVDQIRPQPPCLNRQHFILHEKVDAYDKDGWWVGTIDDVGADNTYIVHFSQSKEKLKYNISQLRLHLDWVDAKWLQPSENPMPLPCCPENGENIYPKPERRSTRANKWKSETNVCEFSTEGKADGLCGSLENAGTQLTEKSGKRRGVTKDRLDAALPASRKMNIVGRDVEDTESYPPSKEKQKEDAYGALDPHSTPEKNMIRSFPEKNMIRSFAAFPYLVGIGKTNGVPGSTCETGAKPTLKHIELLAYHSVLKALYLQGAHTWKIEVLLADLRQVLHITNEEAASELRHITYGRYD